MKRYLAGLLLISLVAIVGAMHGGKITIKTLMGEQFDIRVEKYMTINELKKAIEKRIDIKAESQDLLFCGKLIRCGWCTLQDFGMDDTDQPITVKHSIPHTLECPTKCWCLDAYYHNIAISHIFIEFNGTREKLNYTNLNTDSTVADLKLAIQKRLQIPIDEQLLIAKETYNKKAGHRLLNDADKLTEYGFFKFKHYDDEYPHIVLVQVK